MTVARRGERVGSERFPFFVQAYNSRKSEPWVTDSRHSTAPLAVCAAKQLRKLFDRTVRVVDESEKVWYQAGITKPVKRRSPR